MREKQIPRANFEYFHVYKFQKDIIFFDKATAV